MDRGINNSFTGELCVQEIVESNLLESLIYDCLEYGIFSKEFSMYLLMENVPSNLKAKKFLRNVQECLEQGLVPVDNIVKVFYKNGFQQIAEYIQPQISSYYDTRDSSSIFDNEIFTLPNMHSSVSFPSLPRIPLGDPEPFRSLSDEPMEASKQPFEVKVIPSRFIYGGKINDGIYKNESTPRGFMLLVNISKFDNEVHKTREGSHVDAQNLNLLFSQMGYVVEEHSNVTYMQLKKVLRDFTEHERLAKVDSCVVAIMSHGIENRIITSDNRQIDWNDIRDYFSNVNCPHLLGKPKIFIFQCCRGTTPDVGVEVHPTLSCISNDRNESDLLSIDGTSMGHTMPITTHPTHTDMFIIFATIEGYVAYLNRERGSWLVEAICLEFMEHAHNTDLDALMKMVSKRLSNFHSDKGRKQTSELRSYGFVNHFYFNPQPLNTSALTDLKDMNQALPQYSFLTPSTTPPHLRRHFKWESQSRNSTPEPLSIGIHSNFDFDSKSRHGSEASVLTQDCKFCSSCTSLTNLCQDCKQRNLFRPKPLFDYGSDVVDVPRRRSDTLVPLPTTNGDSDLMASEDDIHQGKLKLSESVQDFKTWRKSLAKNSDVEMGSTTSLKRQLSIPSESEAMTKLHSLSNYLQVNELDELLPALEPIRDVIMKKKNKHKKKKGQANSLDI